MKKNVVNINHIFVFLYFYTHLISTRICKTSQKRIFEKILYQKHVNVDIIN